MDWSNERNPVLFVDRRPQPACCHPLDPTVFILERRCKRSKMPCRAGLLTEGDIEADKKAGIKWAEDHDWKLLHDMDLQMIKDFIKHKEDVKEDAPAMSMGAGGIAGSAEAGDDPPVRKKKKKGDVMRRIEPMGIGEQRRIFPSPPNHKNI